MVTVYGEMKKGYNEICNMKDNHPDMLMDIGIQVMEAGETLNISDAEKETVVLLLDGEVTFRWEGREADAVRRSIFDENPVALHVAYGVEISITAKDNAELLIQKTTNEKSFASRLYTQDDVGTEIFRRRGPGKTQPAERAGQYLITITRLIPIWSWAN